MIASLFGKLRAVVDGDACTFTPEEAKALHAELWDVRGRLASLERRNAALNAENNTLVAGILAEERRAVAAEIRRGEAEDLVRQGVREIANPKRWRERASRWLAAQDLVRSLRGGA